MSGIRAKDTKPELNLRRALHARGLRFRLHVRELPGRPDIVLPRHRAVILVHGCFWHRHNGCRYCYSPGSNPEFWKLKFAGTVGRDQKNHADLLALGWRVATVWECALSPKEIDATCATVMQWLAGTEEHTVVPRIPILSR